MYIARKLKVAHPDAEVHGSIMQAFLDNVKANLVQPLLNKYDLTEIEAEGWYKQQVFLNIYADLAEGKDDESIVAIGMQTMEKTAFPTEITTVYDALNVLPTAYRMTHRNVPEEEGWQIKRLAPTHLQVIFNAPYPDDAAFGYLYVIAKNYKPKTHTFSVRPLPHAEDEVSRFDVKWWRI